MPTFEMFATIVGAVLFAFVIRWGWRLTVIFPLGRWQNERMLQSLVRTQPLAIYDPLGGVGYDLGKMMGLQEDLEMAALDLSPEPTHEQVIGTFPGIARLVETAHAYRQAVPPTRRRALIDMHSRRHWGASRKPVPDEIDVDIG